MKAYWYGSASTTRLAETAGGAVIDRDKEFQITWKPSSCLLFLLMRSPAASSAQTDPPGDDDDGVGGRTNNMKTRATMPLGMYAKGIAFLITPFSEHMVCTTGRGARNWNHTYSVEYNPLGK